MMIHEEELTQGLDHIKSSPKTQGYVEQLVCRPAEDERTLLESGELDVEKGLIGDNWLSRGYKKSIDGSAHPDMQINIMNSRCIALLAKDKDRWSLAGDQLFIDLDLSKSNLPPGSVLQIGEAKLQITAEPHLGCKKFMERFGKAAVQFVNSEEGKALNLRGVNARVIVGGVVRVGDTVRKVTTQEKS